MKNNNNNEIKDNIKKNIHLDTLTEQINHIRHQLQDTKNLWTHKTSDAIGTMKTQFNDFVHKIQSDIDNVKSNVSLLENELFDIQQNVADKNITLLQEFLRKTIHFSSLSIPVCYLFFSKAEMLMVLLPVAILVVFFDILTKHNPLIRAQYLKTVGFMLRKHEIKSRELFLNGGS
jgi:hypothetical protein